ncbi:MAG: SpoIIE family protein phosphatase [Pseudomonadota bacterium]
MIFLGELRVSATVNNLGTLSFFVRGIGQRLQLSAAVLSDVDLAVEAVAASIVRQGYPSGLEGDILLRLEIEADELRLIFTHWGLPLDPNEVRPFDANADLETPVKREMGLHLARDLMDSVQTQPALSPGGPNLLTLIKKVVWEQGELQQDATQRELDALVSVSQSLTAGAKLNTLLELIVNKLVETLQADRGTLYLVDEDKDELYSCVLLDDKLDEIRVKIGQGISGHVAATGKPLNISHAYEDSRFFKSIDQSTGYRSESMLCVPMYNPQKKIIGVVQLLNKKRGIFTSRDERLLTAMAAQAAVSIENTRLYAQELEQQAIKQEIEMTRKIQESFLPREDPHLPGLDIAGACIYCDQTGGDYYDYIPVGQDGRNRLAVVVGDVSGHGLSSTLLMATARAELRLRASMPGSASDIISDLNRLLCDDASETGQFVTMLYLVLDQDHKVMRWVRAGHEPPLIYDVNQDGFSELTGQGMALGLAEDFKYPEYVHPLNQGQVILMGTDGIWEMHNPEGRMFGKEALKDIMRRQAAAPAAEILKSITSALEQFRGPLRPEDDVTLVVVKVTE